VEAAKVAQLVGESSENRVLVTAGVVDDGSSLLKVRTTAPNVVSKRSDGEPNGDEEYLQELS
jgi:hypothetical protein